MREARVHVDDAEFDAMGIEGLVAACREAGIRDVEELACHGTGAVVRVETEAPIDEERLAAVDAVDEWELAAESATGHVYVVSFTAPELPANLADLADDLVGTCEPDVGDRGATMSLVGPQEAIAAVIDAYESADLSPDLRRLGAYEGRDRPLDDLTEKQREAVRTAYEMGYYEVPREVSTAAVAAELDLDPSTVAEHLQRAERNLLSHHL